MLGELDNILAELEGEPVPRLVQLCIVVKKNYPVWCNKYLFKLFLGGKITISGLQVIHT